MEPVIGSARLFDALEHMGQSPGADMRSPGGPSGLPSDEAQRAFREAMDPPAHLDAASGVEGGSPQAGFGAPESMPGNAPDGKLGAAPNAALDIAVDGAPRLQAPAAPGPAEFVPGPQNVDGSLRFEGVSQGEPPPGDLGRAFSNLTDGGALTPVELYQLQYDVGMLHGHLSVLLKSSQSLTQSLESTLKQSG